MSGESGGKYDFVGDYLAGDTGSELGPRPIRNEFGEYVEYTDDSVAHLASQSSLGGRARHQQVDTQFTKKRNAPEGARKSAYEQHVEFMQYIRGGGVYTQGGPKRKKKAANADLPERTDVTVLQDNFQFIRDDEKDQKTLTEGNSNEAWEVQLARKYYNRLFKEYALCNLDKYKTGEIGLRWRTKDEVINGKGHFICANLACEETKGLHSYEVKFTYKENSQTKRTLVKVRVCRGCALKLFYKKIKKIEKKRKRQKPSEATTTTAHSEEYDEQESKLPDLGLLKDDPHQYASAVQSYFSNSDEQENERIATCIDREATQDDSHATLDTDTEENRKDSAPAAKTHKDQEDEMDKFLDTLFD